MTNLELIDADCELEARDYSLGQLADSANDAIKMTCHKGIEALHYARRTGAFLTIAKEKCEHGDWEDWLATHFCDSLDTAQNCMRIYREWPTIEAALAAREDSLIRKMSQSVELQISESIVNPDVTSKTDIKTESVRFLEHESTEASTTPDVTSKSKKHVPSFGVKAAVQLLADNSVREKLLADLPKTIRDRINSGELAASTAQMKALALADKGVASGVARDIRTGKQPDLAKAMAAAGIEMPAKKPVRPKSPKVTKPTTIVEHAPSEAGCSHEHKCWCPNCGLTYCTNCDPEHESECRLKRDAIEAAESKTDEKRYKEARRAMGVLVRWFDAHGQGIACKVHLETLAHLLG